MRVYIAGPFFNDKQIEIVEKVKEILEENFIEYHSPKDHSLYKPGGSITPKQCFESNIEEIKECDFIIAITDGLDAGTLFECGAAYILNKEICYLWVDNHSKKFNLMLSESASALCYSYEDLDNAIEWRNVYKVWPNVNVKGEVE